MNHSNFNIAKKTTPIVSALLVGTFLFGTGLNHAQARMQVKNLSCSDAKSLIRTKRQVTVSFNSNTYDSVVSNRIMCSIKGKNAKRVRTQTADVSSCGIGYRCVERIKDNKTFDDKPSAPPPVTPPVTPTDPASDPGDSPH